ncbi:MAG: fumarylacetoacetate hydrolase family protein [Burkholderiaceae bacterium]
MTPQDLLDHCDSGQLWPEAVGNPAFPDLPTAYEAALAVRELRLARGEVPRGFKIGFTNRGIWPRYNVFAPIWGFVWSTTLSTGDAGETEVSLAGLCQPRIEPEAVFGMKATPRADASLGDLFDALDWVAPGFEIVQSHRPGWKFVAPDTVADGGLHGHLLVGKKVPVGELAQNAQELQGLLAGIRLGLHRNSSLVEEGVGANVLDDPLRALHHFLKELRACPGAPDLRAGDLITTGTWTDAWTVEPGERWRARFSAHLPELTVGFV